MNSAATGLRFELDAQVGVGVFNAQAHLGFAIEWVGGICRNVVPNGVLVYNQKGIDVGGSVGCAVIRAFSQCNIGIVGDDDAIGKTLPDFAPSVNALAPHVGVGCVVVEFNSRL